MLKTLLLAGASALAMSATSAEAVTFTYTGALQQYDVTKAGYYQIDAYGAQGGAQGDAGLGAAVGGDIYLAASTKLEVLVGGAGSWFPNYGGSGGGASAVFTPALAPLVVAGAGGGASWFGYGGGAGQSGPAYGSHGGTGGSGGGGQLGGGGGGWLGPGAGGGSPTAGGGGYGPPSFAGGTGGLSENDVTFPGCCGSAPGGGFGGGGGGGYSGGGGGGGYSGGADGEGGGSYVVAGATHILGESGVQSGNGLVTIDFLGVPEPSAWSLMITGLGFLGYVLRRRLTGRLRRA
jgi:hypothetical protein